LLGRAYHDGVHLCVAAVSSFLRWILRRIPEIVNEYDEMENGGISKRGLQTVRYIKKYPDGIAYYVEEEWKGEKKMAAKTMYKKKAGNQ